MDRALARVSSGAVERNVRMLRSRVARPARLCCVVKSRGYGHGAVECAWAALRGGADWIAVASADEAAELRAGGITARLFVMGALTDDDLHTALGADADINVWTPEHIEAAAAAGGARVHVKFDSGMGRLGTKDPAEARWLCDRVAGDDRLELAGVWTHFATADELGDDYFPRQLRAFGDLAAYVKQAHPGTLAHAANSAATLRDAGAHFDLVRCGVAIYGLDPFQRDPAEQGLEPALELTSYVAGVKRFDTGDSAGYGRAWHAPQPTWVAAVPIGYGDGWRRDLTNNADVLIRGRRHPLAGRVSMDNITVDLGPDTDVEPGDEVVLIGTRGEERILAEELAGRLGTINYDVTCGLSRRVRYLHGP